jgi:hypothetical protein
MPALPLQEKYLFDGSLVQDRSGGTGFQPVQAQAKACGSKK